MQYRLGRKPRAHDPRIPHYGALLRPALPPVPASVDNTSGITDFGAMLNDQLGCCTCSAVYHALQIWNAKCTGKPNTQPGVEVLSFYELSCGYVPGNPQTDQGGVEQNVLKEWMNFGAPTLSGVDRLIAYVEVDRRNLDDVKRTIWECGVAYLGVQLPSQVMPPNAEPPEVWDLTPGDYSIGGHAIIAVAYKNAPDGSLLIGVISWGKLYWLTQRFFAGCVDECYALASPDWIEATGMTPLGLTQAQLTAQMQYLVS